MNNIISISGILISIILIVLLSTKGVSILISSAVASVVVILLNGMDLASSMISVDNSYMRYLSDFITNFFPIFAFGSIIGKYLDESGAAKKIAKAIMQKSKSKAPFQGMLVVFLITSLLTYGGISLYVVVFVVVPLAKPLFKELGIPWRLVTAPLIMGLGTITLSMLPGTPSIANVIPTRYLGTSLTAAPVESIIASIVAIITALVLLKMFTKGIVPNAEKEDIVIIVEENTKNEPNVIQSITPLVLLILIIIVGSALKIPNIILIALIATIIMEAIIFNKYIKSHIKVLNSGVVESVLPIISTASTIAFGNIITKSPAFSSIVNMIIKMPGNPIISLSVVTSAFSAITGSASGATGIVTPIFSKIYVEKGVSPEIIHRIISISSGVFAPAPHSGVVITMLALTGLNNKEGWKQMFISAALVNGVALIAVILYISMFS